MRKYGKKSTKCFGIGCFQKSGVEACAAFLFAFAGTLVWVNGRGGWFIMRLASLPSFAPSLSLSYTLWLVVYAVFGMIFVQSLCFGGVGGKKGLINTGLLLVSYFLSLLWHPLFYSAYFLIPALLTLLVSASASGLFMIRVVRRSFCIALETLIILLIQVYFIVFTAGCF